MNLERQIRRLNTLLRTELGSITPTQYAWRHSSTLIRHYYRSNPDGSPMYEHVVSESGNLLSARRVMAQRLLHPELPNNWVLCAWVDDYDERGGGYAPLTFVKYTKLGPMPDIVALSPGEIPTLPATQEVCRLLRDHHSRTLMQHRYEHEDKENRRLRYELDPTARTVAPDARQFASALGVDPAYVSAPGSGALRFEGQEYDQLKDRIKEDLGVSTEPGKKREKSFASAPFASVPGD